jgi:FkbH-like protein
MSRQARSRDFPGVLKAAVETADLERRIEQLSKLAAAEPSYLETIQIDRALTSLPPGEQSSHVVVRLAMLGATTIDHLLPAARVAGLRRNLLLSIQAGKFGQYRQELLGPDPSIKAFRPQFVLLAPTSHDLVAGVPLAASRDAADRAVQGAVADLRELWRAARERFGAAPIQQSFLDVAPPVFGSHDRLIPGSPSRLTARLNDAVADAAAEDAVLFLDLASASARDGIDAWFDQRHWLQGKIQIAPQAAAKYGELLARLLASQVGRSRKVLVLDLDNTLWGGVLGDDGIEGVKLGQGSAIGEAHLALQKYAKLLGERGVVLAVCSKNEPANVEAMFDQHPEMWLERSDIAAFAVDWNDKAENLRKLAEKLNLGLDSFVFVDDNPAERARIRESLPMVAVPELPDDPAYYVRTLARAGYFEATVLTDEDRERSTQYAANNEREALKSSTQSVDDFLRGLRMEVIAGRVGRVDLARATQLVNKTNQFNTTTQRLAADEVERWAADPTALVLQFRLVDRFGDNGLVSVMLFRRAAGDARTFELKNWVMSCRVFGRRLEHEAMNIAVEAALAQGVERIVADYVPTPKNGVVSDLYDKLGLTRIEDATLPVGAARWTLDLAQYRPHATHITRKQAP